MPDLGDYALWVLASYAASLALLGGMVGWYWLRARRVRAQLEQVEARQDGPK